MREKLQTFFALATLTLLVACGGDSNNAPDSGPEPQEPEPQEPEPQEPDTQEPEPVSYSVSSHLDGEGQIDPSAQVVIEGESVGFTVTPAEGHQIKSISGCSGERSEDGYVTGAISADCTVTATFEPKTYTANAVAGAGGEVEPAEQLVSHGDSVEFTVTPHNSFRVATAEGCGGSYSEGVYTTGDLTAECEVTISFEEIIAPPTGLSPEAYTDRIGLSWNDVNNAAGYNLYYDTQPDIDVNNPMASDNGDWAQDVTAPYELTGLEPDTEYYFVVSAYTEDGQDSRPSNMVMAQLLKVGPGFTMDGLNDTGIGTCGTDSTNDSHCPVPHYPGQDGEVGRDAAALSGELDKVGEGAAGFDFTKLDAQGQPLPADADSWSCVQDNHTGMVWEAKSDDETDLQYYDHRYSWYNPVGETNFGEPGRQDAGSCVGSECDTYAYANAISARELCGYDDWRVPNRTELLSIWLDRFAHERVDQQFFPNVSLARYWTSSTQAHFPSRNWSWRFGGNSPQMAALNKGLMDGRVLLVRSDSDEEGDEESGDE